ncbi:MAG: 2-dehydropantoate 2-reductase [Helicobacteraceae bacterium]|nr:2-dehydropantoate 2-reductase [Helicobacteraceae bacterium]
MRVAVVGLGGVGGYIAASLAKTSYDVVGFARGAHLEAIKKNGLRIVEDERSYSVALDVRALDEVEGSFDIVLFCVKSYDLAQAYKALEHTLHPKSILLSFSNGVANGDTLRSLSDARVLDGCVYILSHIESEGVVRKKGRVFAAVFGGESEAASTLSALFDEADLRYKTPENIQEALWKKYLFISAFATLTSYYDKSIGALMKENLQEVQSLLKEINSVAKAKGIDISAEVQKALETAASLPYDASTSMHLDFQNHKKTELEALSGYILKEAQRYQIATPLMQRCYERLVVLSPL